MATAKKGKKTSNKKKSSKGKKNTNNLNLFSKLMLILLVTAIIITAIFITLNNFKTIKDKTPNTEVSIKDNVESNTSKQQEDDIKQESKGNNEQPAKAEDKNDIKQPAKAETDKETKQQPKAEADNETETKEETKQQEKIVIDLKKEVKETKTLNGCWLSSEQGASLTFDGQGYRIDFFGVDASEPIIGKYSIDGNQIIFLNNDSECKGIEGTYRISFDKKNISLNCKDDNCKERRNILEADWEWMEL